MPTLSGYKTYLVAGLMAILAIARSLGWIDDALYETLLGLLGSAGLATLRAGVAKHGASQ